MAQAFIDDLQVNASDLRANSITVHRTANDSRHILLEALELCTEGLVDVHDLFRVNAVSDVIVDAITEKTRLLRNRQDEPGERQ